MLGRASRQERGSAGIVGYIGIGAGSLQQRADDLDVALLASEMQGGCQRNAGMIFTFTFMLGILCAAGLSGSAPRSIKNLTIPCFP